MFCPEKEAGAGSFAYDIVKKFVEEGKAQVVNLVIPCITTGRSFAVCGGRCRNHRRIS